MNYKRGINRKTTADVFYNNSPTPKRGCTAWVDGAGNLLCVEILNKQYNMSELKELGVVCIDFYRKDALYL